MFFCSLQLKDLPAPHSHWIFVRDLGASILALGALGVLLVAIDGKSGRAARTPPQAAGLVEKSPARAAQAPRQPTDVLSIPDEREARIRDAMIAFALSKVAHSQIEPSQIEPAQIKFGEAKIAHVKTPQTAGSHVEAVAPPRKPRKAAAAPAAGRIPAGAGRAGFAQAEWPVAIAATPRARPVREVFPVIGRLAPDRLAPHRFVPEPGAILKGARTVVADAGKSVGAGINGLREGAVSVTRGAIALGGRLW